MTRHREPWSDEDRTRLKHLLAAGRTMKADVSTDESMRRTDVVMLG
jgi:hypothetical protein